MSLWGIATIAVVGSLIHKARKNAKEAREEDARRTRAWHGFVDDISEHDFELIVRTAGKGIKRLRHVSTHGPIVCGSVRTQSGVSEWDFQIDFNDYGHLTGTYWLSSDNDDSSIPEHFANNISALIQDFTPDDDIDDSDNTETLYTKLTNGWMRPKGFCPYCGKAVTAKQAVYCVYCGNKLR